MLNALNVTSTGYSMERKDLEQDNNSKQEHKAANQQKTKRASEKGQI